MTRSGLSCEKIPGSNLTSHVGMATFIFSGGDDGGVIDPALDLARYIYTVKGSDPPAQIKDSQVCFLTVVSLHTNNFGFSRLLTSPLRIWTKFWLRLATKKKTAKLLKELLASFAQFSKEFWFTTQLPLKRQRWLTNSSRN
jgi:hypothetical protein